MTLTRTVLDPETLMARAEEAAGVDDWGEPPFREALEILCDSARREAALSTAGEEALSRRIVEAGAKRLQFYADRKRYEEIPRQEIVRPIILTGLPRSGTTILHALLAQDPAARSPLTWELAEPSPPPRTETFDSDPRIARTAAALDQLDPLYRTMHAAAAQLPEECNAIMTMAFQTLNYWSTADLPTYTSWLLHESDARPAYALHRHFLQHLQAFAPGRWWALKSSPHMFWLDQVMATYPDARVVMTHRDPAAALPSNASTIAFLRRGTGCEDPLVIGREQVSTWGQGISRALAYRESGVCAGQFFDSQYADFVRDPLEAVEAIYDYFDMPLSEEARRRMQAYMAKNRKDAHGKHHYTPEQFGLDAKGLRREFAEYIETFSIALG